MILSQTAQNHKTAVRFDRSARHWLCINGTTTTHATKEAALLAALTNDHPDLAAHVPHLARLHSNIPLARWLKAAALVAKGKVFSGGTVGSQSRPDVFHQTTFDGTPAKYTCGCEATVTDEILGKTCCHCLAQHLAYLAGIELPAPPVSLHGETVVINGADINDAGLPF